MVVVPLPAPAAPVQQSPVPCPDVNVRPHLILPPYPTLAPSPPAPTPSPVVVEVKNRFVCSNKTKGVNKETMGSSGLDCQHNTSVKIAYGKEKDLSSEKDRSSLNSSDKIPAAAETNRSDNRSLEAETKALEVERVLNLAVLEAEGAMCPEEDRIERITEVNGTMLDLRNVRYECTLRCQNHRRDVQVEKESELPGCVAFAVRYEAGVCHLFSKCTDTETDESELAKEDPLDLFFLKVPR